MIEKRCKIAENLEKNCGLGLGNKKAENSHP